MKRRLDTVPFEDWVAEAQAGHVGYDPAATQGCADELANAACGQPVATALFDGTCFAFEPPPGGPLQRAMFERTAGVGDSCYVMTSAGFGAGFFGTCDPSSAFCCYEDPEAPGECALPSDGLSGMCAAAGDVSDDCSSMPPLLLCKTGLSCDGYTSKCDEDGSTPLSVGDECVDDSWTLLGDCPDGYYDLLGTGLCEPWKQDGDGCTAPTECESLTCEEGGSGAVCAPWSFCVP